MNWQAKALIENGARLQIEDEDGYTAMELAKRSGYTEIADMIEHGMKKSKLL